MAGIRAVKDPWKLFTDKCTAFLDVLGSIRHHEGEVERNIQCKNLNPLAIMIIEKGRHLQREVCQKYFARSSIHLSEQVLQRGKTFESVW